MNRLSRAIFLNFILMVFSYSAWAQSLSVSSPSTSDSSVMVHSNLPREVKWVWIQVSKGSKKEDFISSVEDSSFSQKVWLRFGSGEYTLSARFSNHAARLGTYRVGNSLTVKNSDNRANLEFLLPTSDSQSENQEIVELAQALTDGLASDLEKTQMIHDWVATHIAYDVESFLSGAYVNNPGDALTVLKNEIAVCDGYSNLTIALNRAVGIPTRKVLGEAIVRGSTWSGITNHAWVETLVDGRWITQDPTWNAGTVDFQKKIFSFKLSQKYFDPDPSVFARDHRAE